MTSNKTYLISGSKWLTISSVVSSLTYLLTLAILARILSKSDFGIIAIITFIQGLMQMLSGLGFSSSIMHKKEISILEFYSLFWIQLLVYVIIYIITCIISPIIANYYAEPQLKALLPISLLSLVFLGIGSLHGTILHKNFEYKIISIRDIIASILSLVIAVLLALFGFGVYSLVISLLLKIAIVQIWNFIAGIKYIPISFSVSYDRVKQLATIGFYQTGTNIVDYLGSSLDVLIIGKLLGTEVLGGYNLVKELLTKGLYFLNSIANRVVLPIYSSMQENHTSLRGFYCKHIKVITVISFPICVLLGGLSFDMITIFYGAKFGDMSLVLSILSIWGLLSVIGNPVGGVITATGRTDLSFLYALIRCFYVLPMVYFASTVNILVVASCILMGEIISFVLSWYLELYKTIEMSFVQIVKSFIPVLILSLLLIVLGNLFSYFDLISFSNIYLRTIIRSLVLALLYVGFCCIVYRELAIRIMKSTCDRLFKYLR